MQSASHSQASKQAPHGRSRAKMRGPLVRELVVRRLTATHFPQLRRIHCEYHEGVLTLRGVVSSYHLKQVAQAVLVGVDGVDEIANRLEVGLSSLEVRTLAATANAATAADQSPPQQFKECVPMLVLSRKVGEKVIIGDHITVTVAEIRGDRVRLGFSCPAEIPVHREEVRQRLLECSQDRPRTAKLDESAYYAEFA